MSVATYCPAQSRITRSVLRPVEVEVRPEVPEKITLELTRGEAQALLDLATAIGGHPKLTRRGVTDEIHGALAGLNCGLVNKERQERDWTGSIYFLE